MAVRLLGTFAPLFTNHHLNLQVNDKLLSIQLSRILRHTAEKDGVPINCQGYVKVQDLLHHRHLQAYNVEDVKRVVANNNKNRFTLRNYLGVLEICANQGHSIKVPNNYSVAMCFFL